MPLSSARLPGGAYEWRDHVRDYSRGGFEAHAFGGQPTPDIEVQVALELSRCLQMLRAPDLQLELQRDRARFDELDFRGRLAEHIRVRGGGIEQYTSHELGV